MGAPSRPRLPPPPPPAPDLADEAIRKARSGELSRQMSSSGRKSTFVSGLLGDTSAVPTTPKKLLGS